MFTDLLYRLRAIFRRNATEDELDEELAFHIQHQVESHVRRGMTPEEAARHTRLSLGGTQQLKEEVRESWGIRLWDTTVQDVRYAARQLLRNPVFTLSIILTLGLGIGATTALFTVANSVLLRSLPVERPSELVVISRDPERSFPLHSLDAYDLMRDQTSRVFTGVAAFNYGNAVGFSTHEPGHNVVPEVVGAAFVSANYFKLLGVGAAAGRTLTPEDDSPSAINPVVLSYQFWQRRLAGNLAVLGQSVRLNGADCIVTGIVTPHFRGTSAGSAPDVYVPLRTFPDILPLMRKNWNAPRRQWLGVIARLKPGAAIAQATAQLDSLNQADPGGAKTPNKHAVLLPAARGFSPFASQLAEPLWILLSAAGLLLILACANVAGLLLARSVQRQREIAVRLSLGAGRLRLVRQLMTESVVLALLGGALGLFIGLAGASALVQFLPSGGPLPFSPDLSPDSRVLGFAFAVSVATGLLFGLGPAFRASRGDLAIRLKGSRLTGWLRLDMRRALVVIQMSLSLVLLVGVALLARSLTHLEALDLGYSRTGMLFVYVQPSQFGYQRAQIQQFYERLREQVAVLPGVTQTSLADFAPLDSGNDSGTLSAPGNDAPVAIETNTVTEGYLATLGIPLIAGRDFNRQDARQGAPAAALVSESLARLLFRNENPIGRRVSYGDRYQPAESLQIVGVVGEAHYFGLKAVSTPMLYVPVDGSLARLTLCVRTASAPEQLVAAVRRTVAALDPAVPVLEATTMTQRVNQENSPQRLLTSLLGSFGLMALVLAAIGLYGVLAFGVAARTREIGIRSALGASRFDAMARVVSDVWVLVGAGVATGCIVSLATVRLLAGFLFGVQPVDAGSFVSAIAVLVGTAAVASYLPARRASRVDPSIALRHE